MVPPRSVLRMRVEREEVPFCGIIFEWKTQRHQAFNIWAKRVLALLELKKLLNQMRVLKTIIWTRSIAIENNSPDLQFLIS